MITVLVATEKPFAGIAVNGMRDVINRAGFEFILLENYTAREQLVEAVRDVDALIVRSDIVDEKVISSARNLKIVVRAGAGYDNIDLDAATAKGIVVMNTPGQNSNAVAELSIGLLIYLNRNSFNGTSGIELSRKTIGIHGCGNVGRLIGVKAKGIGMDVYTYDPYVDEALVETYGIKAVGKVQELYGKCQYISLNLPANKNTRESITFDLLSLMPEGATLLNTARKEIIHEPSLLKMFAGRKDFRYATDVAPDCSSQLQSNYPGRYIATQKKMGAQTDEANINAGMAAARQIVNFLLHGNRQFRVN
jgi:D-3-phosphoglycerate dehydrogenase / 2-oxoglutarate reductase